VFQVEQAPHILAQADYAAAVAGLRYVSDEDTPGIRRERHGRGFTYRDAEGRPIRGAAFLKRVHALAIPPAWTGVWISPDADAHLAATGRDAKGRKQYRYNPAFVEVPHMKPGSAIIATASEQAYDPSPELYDYAQTKAATMNYVKSLAKQLAKKGIRVNGVAPGPIWTPLQVSGGASMDKLEKFGGQTPMGRPGQPAELASIYVQLAAEDASYTTGQIYGSSGGAGQP
jgi:enoyl-ACP reductase-like protein/DNA topoisomerase IB-like protein